MKSELQITYRNMKPSAEIEKWIHAEAAKLDTLYSRVMGCRVAVEVPHRHHRKGSPYHIRIDLTVPRGEIVVKREPSLNAQARHLGERESKKRSEVKVPHKELRQAINDALKAAGRRLQDYARRQRGDIKSPTLLPRGSRDQDLAAGRLRIPDFGRRTGDLFPQEQRSRPSLPTSESRDNSQVC